MNLITLAFVDPTLFAATMTLKHGRHFSDNDQPSALSEPPFQDTKHIILRGLPDPNWNADVEQVDYPILSEWTSARQLIDNIKSKITEHLAAPNITFGKAFIESVNPGGFIGWHVDDSPYGREHFRHRLLVTPCAGGQWFSAGESIAPGVGNLTYFNNRVLHSIINLGPVPQVSVVVDARKPTMQ